MKVWYGELDRFGYTLRAVGRTKDETVSALMDEYVAWFKSANDGEDPDLIDANDEVFFEGGKWLDWDENEVDRDKVHTLADAAREDITLWDGVLGKAMEI